MKGAQTIYGIHAVRVMLERHAERVLGVRLAQRRDDPRVRAIEDLARRHERPVQRVDSHSLRQQLGYGNKRRRKVCADNAAAVGAR